MDLVVHAIRMHYELASFNPLLLTFPYRTFPNPLQLITYEKANLTCYACNLFINSLQKGILLYVHQHCYWER